MIIVLVQKSIKKVMTINLNIYFLKISKKRIYNEIKSLENCFELLEGHYNLFLYNEMKL